jgi:hypothetical protein
MSCFLLLFLLLLLLLLHFLPQWKTRHRMDANFAAEFCFGKGMCVCTVRAKVKIRSNSPNGLRFDPHTYTHTHTHTRARARTHIHTHTHTHTPYTYTHAHTSGSIFAAFFLGEPLNTLLPLFVPYSLSLFFFLPCSSGVAESLRSSRLRVRQSVPRFSRTPYRGCKRSTCWLKSKAKFYVPTPSVRLDLARTIGQGLNVHVRVYVCVSVCVCSCVSAIVPIDRCM